MGVRKHTCALIICWWLSSVVVELASSKPESLLLEVDTRRLLAEVQESEDTNTTRSYHKEVKSL
jgi:hypothetical protein